MFDSKTIERLKNSRGILFDLDNTLYSRELGVFDLINGRINDYVRLNTGYRGDEVDAVRREYKSLYGTTLGGLMRHESVDPDEYLEFVHDVPVEEMLRPDPALITFLGSIGLPMAIFTNGTERHARRVIDVLQIAPFFVGICDLAATDYVGKPHRQAFEAATRLLDCSLDRTIFVDDLPVNVQAGSRYCSFSVHVGPGEDGVGDLHVNGVPDLAPVFSPMPWYRESD